MPMVVHPDHVDEFKEALYLVEDFEESASYTAMEVALMDYAQMVENGVPIYEARQVLPGAASVNIIWTVNARSLINFFTQRLCRRNVDEMQTFAKKTWEQVEHYWPEFANCCGPYCYPSGKCNQGRMSCGQPYKVKEI